jgi:tRNA uridine 5-carboxymethylaminomethyl modification enzyme
LEKTRASAEMVQAIAKGFPVPGSQFPESAQGSTENRELRTENLLPSALGNTLAQLLKRPEVTIEHLRPMLQETGHWPLTTDHLEVRSVETEIKYAGYLQQQQRSIERLKKAEQRNIPEWFDYKNVSGLSREMHEKLTRVRPRTIAQASRIPGVTPAALSLINIYIEIQARRHAQAQAL